MKLHTSREVLDLLRYHEESPGGTQAAAGRLQCWRVALGSAAATPTPSLEAPPRAPASPASAETAWPLLRSYLTPPPPPPPPVWPSRRGTRPNSSAARKILRSLRTTRDGAREGEKEGCKGGYLRPRKRLGNRRKVTTTTREFGYDSRGSIRIDHRFDNLYTHSNSS